MVVWRVAMMAVHSVASRAEQWDDYLAFCLVARMVGLMVVDWVVRKEFLTVVQMADWSVVRWV